MPSAVEQGIKAAARAGAKKAAEHAQDAKGLLRLDLQGGEVCNCSRKRSVCVWPWTATSSICSLNRRFVALGLVGWLIRSGAARFARTRDEEKLLRTGGGARARRCWRRGVVDANPEFLYPGLVLRLKEKLTIHPSRVSHPSRSHACRHVITPGGRGLVFFPGVLVDGGGRRRRGTDGGGPGAGGERLRHRQGCGGRAAQEELVL